MDTDTFCNSIRNTIHHHFPSRSRFAARDRVLRERGVGLIDGVVTQFELITMKIEAAIAIHIPACSRRIGLYSGELSARGTRGWTSEGSPGKRAGGADVRFNWNS